MYRSAFSARAPSRVTFGLSDLLQSCPPLVPLGLAAEVPSKRSPLKGGLAGLPV